MKQKKVIITHPCVTADGDRFAGDEYCGEGAKGLVKAGFAKWVEETVVPESGVSPAQPSGTERVFCQVDGCRRWKTEPCPVCEQPTCTEHMDTESGMCIPCAQEASGEQEEY